MKNQKGFGVIIVLVLFLLLGVLFFGSRVYFEQYKKMNPLEIGDKISGITSFDACIKHPDGSIEFKNLGPDQETIFRYVGCDIGGSQGWPATNLDKCSVTECESLTDAFISYCNNEYRGSHSIPSNQNLKLGYREDALVSNGYARGSIICHESDDQDWFKKYPVNLIFQEQSGQWKFLMLLSADQTCKDFDNRGIPPQITGNCYDDEIVGQLKRYRIPR